MNERIAKLAEKVLRGEMFPEVQSVEFDREDLFLPRYEKDAKQIYEYVMAQSPVLTEYSTLTGLFRFDGSVPGDAMTQNGLHHLKEALRYFYCKPVDRLATLEWQHATADFGQVIQIGVRGLQERIAAAKETHRDDCEKSGFLLGLESAARALIDWAHKCSGMSRELAEQTTNPEYRENLLRLSAALLRVPEFPAENFYEAILSIYVLFSYSPDSLGRLDQTLLPFYRKEIAEGTLTREKAQEYLQELFLMLQSRVSIHSDRFTKGGESHFCVGGYLPDGEDGFTELSMLILESVVDLPTYIPQISLRWTKKLPFEIFRQVLLLERSDPRKRIAFRNDEAAMKFYREVHGVPLEIACRYSSAGCNETAFPGGFVAGGTSNNILRSVENTFFQRTEEVLAAKDFEEFFQIYTEELQKDLDEMLFYSDAFNRIRSKDVCYVSSLLFPDCIDAAKPYSQGPVRLAQSGVGIIGMVNVVDSLTVIRQFVYEEKNCTMQEMVDALRNNWVGYEALRARIRKNGKFFGNNEAISDDMAGRFMDTVYAHLKTRRNLFGYTLGTLCLQGYNVHHEIFGKLTRATPDGRVDGEMLKFSVGQSGGYEREGLTAMLLSAANCYRHNATGVTNLTLDAALVRNAENFEKTARLLETYFQMGGGQFQLNYLSREELLEAQEKPEEHSSLRVRVSGFSDFFNNLPTSAQNDVIARTTHSV